MGLLYNHRLRKAFNRMAGNDRLIDYDEWKSALRLHGDMMPRRMFSLVDLDGSGYIDFNEFREFVSTLREGSVDDKIEFVFRSCDLSDTSRITRAEIHEILSSDLVEQGLSIDRRTIDKMIVSLFKQAGLNPRSGITLKAFGNLLRDQADISQQCDSFLSSLIGLKPARRRGRQKASGWIRRTFTWLRSRAREIFWTIAYLAINVLLFKQAMDHYAANGATLAVQLARGGGACLNLNAALVLLPMCKSLASTIHHSFLLRLLPLEHLTTIHRWLAYATIGFSIEHTAAHIWNYLQVGENITVTLLQTTIGITGVAMLVILLVMWLTTWFRKRIYRGFVWIHFLYVIFLAGLLLHVPMFWKWLAPVMVLFLLDRIIRYSFRRRKVEITALEALSDQVTSVRFKRGQVFNFHPGDYIRVRIPQLGYEWHPFTISAAPEATRFDIHVRNNGDWSGALHNLAGQSHAERKKWPAYIDGPYSTPTSSIYRSKVAVLIAGGIGVTPFASVLQSLLHNRTRREDKNTPEVIHFHWLNRSQKSYEWFIDLLTRAEKQLGAERFQLNLHLTSMTRNLSNTIMQIALGSYWRERDSDPITGLHARTASGRPNWNRIFAQLREQHQKERIDIYFCGPPGLGKSIRQAANRHGLNYREEKF